MLKNIVLLFLGITLNILSLNRSKEVIKIDKSYCFECYTASNLCCSRYFLYGFLHCFYTVPKTYCCPGKKCLCSSLCIKLCSKDFNNTLGSLEQDIIIIQPRLSEDKADELERRIVNIEKIGEINHLQILSRISVIEQYINSISNEIELSKRLNQELNIRINSMYQTIWYLKEKLHMNESSILKNGFSKSASLLVSKASNI